MAKYDKRPGKDPIFSEAFGALMPGTEVNPYVWLLTPYRDCIISVPDIRIRASPYDTKKPWRAIAAGQGVEKTMNEKGTKKTYE